MFTLASVRQYANASVVTLHIDGSELGSQDGMFSELKLEAPYICAMHSGGGNGLHYFFDFVVSPPLPESLSEIAFEFTVSGASDQPGSRLIKRRPPWHGCLAVNCCPKAYTS